MSATAMPIRAATLAGRSREGLSWRHLSSLLYSWLKTHELLDAKHFEHEPLDRVERRSHQWCDVGGGEEPRMLRAERVAVHIYRALAGRVHIARPVRLVAKCQRDQHDTAAHSGAHGCQIASARSTPNVAELRHRNVTATGQLADERVQHLRQRP